MKPAQKITVFMVCIGVALFFLLTRLYYLQVIMGEAYLERSESNFIQERLIKHSRGRILDKDGNTIADNRLAYDVYITFALLPDSLKNLRILAESLKIPKSELLEFDKELLERVNNNIEDFLTLKENLELEQCQEILEIARTKLLTGIKIEKTTGPKTSCKVLISSTLFPSQRQTLNYLANLLNMPVEVLLDPWQKAQNKSGGIGRFRANLLLSDVGFDAYARIENAISLGSLSGISVIPAKRRRYVHGNFATQLIGFVNQVSLSDIQKKSEYRPGDFIGRSGIEASFEEILRGKDGVERVVVDAKGRRFDVAWEESLLGEKRVVLPKAGRSIKLTIDSYMQEAAEELFKGVAGSVIISEVETGNILAMASFPNFDLNNLVSGDNSKFFGQLINDKLKPLRNKAIQDHYAPGSIFKPITAIAGLSKKLITPSYQHYCSGTYQIHRTMWRCFKREGHGAISLMDGIKKSCDSYFYELGHRMGLDSLTDVAHKLGIGYKTGIALLGETPGILPTREYYKKRFGYVAPGAVVNIAIGQGELTISPIQMAMAYGAIANGGKLFEPHLVQEILDDEGKVIKKFGPVLKSSVGDSSFSFEEILHGLSFVTEPGGTAYSLRYNPLHADIAEWLKDESISIVGKTGTAQVVKLSKTVKHVIAEQMPYEQRDHAWFVGIYPKVDPKIVVVVMTEHGGMAGSASAPVAVRLMKKWHEKNMRE
jgi:penicillin-binding protein 2